MIADIVGLALRFLVEGPRVVASDPIAARSLRRRRQMWTDAEIAATDPDTLRSIRRAIPEPEAPARYRSTAAPNCYGV